MLVQVELDLKSLQKMKKKAKIMKNNTQIIQFFDNLISQFPEHNLSNFSFAPHEILQLCSNLTNENVLSALAEKARSSFSTYPMIQKVQILDEKLFTLLKFSETNKILDAFDQIAPKRIPYFLKLSDPSSEVFKRLITLRKKKLFECKICFNWVEKEFKQNCNQGHEWCTHCLKNWFEADLILNVDQLYRQQSLDFECLHDNCHEILPQKFLLNTKLTDILKLRDDLIIRQNLLNQAAFRQVIGCPERRCVGIAYIYLQGDPNFQQENLYTCLLCGNEFSPQRETPKDVVPTLILFFSFGILFAILKNPIIPFIFSLTLLVVYDIFFAKRKQLPLECKRCPRCEIVIQKDGGCDHMKCRCGHHFYWSSLEAKNANI